MDTNMDLDRNQKSRLKPDFSFINLSGQKDIFESISRRNDPGQENSEKDSFHLKPVRIKPDALFLARPKEPVLQEDVTGRAELSLPGARVPGRAVEPVPEKNEHDLPRAGCRQAGVSGFGDDIENSRLQAVDTNAVSRGLCLESFRKNISVHADSQLDRRAASISKKEAKIAGLLEDIKARSQELDEKEASLAMREERQAAREEKQVAKEHRLWNMENSLDARKAALDVQQAAIDERSEKIRELQDEVGKKLSGIEKDSRLINLAEDDIRRIFLEVYTGQDISPGPEDSDDDGIMAKTLAGKEAPDKSLLSDEGLRDDVNRDHNLIGAFSADARQELLRQKELHIREMERELQQWENELSVKESALRTREDEVSVKAAKAQADVNLMEEKASETAKIYESIHREKQDLARSQDEAARKIARIEKDEAKLDQKIKQFRRHEAILVAKMAEADDKYRQAQRVLRHKDQIDVLEKAYKDIKGKINDEHNKLRKMKGTGQGYPDGDGKAAPDDLGRSIPGDGTSDAKDSVTRPAGAISELISSIQKAGDGMHNPDDDHKPDDARLLADDVRQMASSEMIVKGPCMDDSKAKSQHQENRKHIPTQIRNKPATKIEEPSEAASGVSLVEAKPAQGTLVSEESGKKTGDASEIEKTDSQTDHKGENKPIDISSQYEEALGFIRQKRFHEARHVIENFVERYKAMHPYSGHRKDLYYKILQLKNEFKLAMMNN